MTNRIQEEAKSLNRELSELAGECRENTAMRDYRDLISLLFCAWTYAKADSAEDIHKVLDASGLPSWAKDTLIHTHDETFFIEAKKLAAMKSVEELRRLTLASYDFVASGSGKLFGEFVTPQSIVELAERVLGLTKDTSLADFGCGWGGFLATEASCAKSVYGSEINSTSALLASMRLSMLGVSYEIELGDMLSGNTDRKFDRCFAQPPLGMRTQYLQLKGTPYEHALTGKGPMGRPASADWVIAQRVFDATEEDGRAVIVMTNGPTFNHGDDSARRHFVSSGRLEAVVALPAKLLTQTSLAVNLIIIGDGSKGVRMIDASDLSVPGRRNCAMGPEEIEAVMERLAQDGPMSRVVSAEEIASRDWNLAPQRYLRRKIELENATKLESVTIGIDRGANLRASELDKLETVEQTGFSYLPVSEISDGRVGSSLPNITSIDPRYERSCLHEGDLVMTKIGSPVRVAVAEVPEGQTIVATGNLYVIRLDSKVIDPYYLAAFFSSDDGQELLSGLATGTTIPTIGLRDLRDLEVPVPSTDVQQRIAERYQAALDEIEVYRVRLERARYSISSAYDKEMGR